jgi:hypothetical protein
MRTIKVMQPKPFNHEIVNYSILLTKVRFNEFGIQDSNSIEYSFKSDDLFYARKQAIKKLKQIVKVYEDDVDNVSGLDAELLGFKNCQGYSVNLFFNNENGSDCIYGEDPEEQVEWLESEANFYTSNNIGTKVKLVKDSDGKNVGVLGNDLKFLLSNLN